LKRILPEAFKNKLAIMIKTKIPVQIKKVKARSRGLSLLEVMFTVLILSISIMTLLQGISQGIMMLEAAEKLSIAALLAKKKMAQLEIDEFKISAESSGIFEENKDYSWKVEFKDPELEEAKNFSISQVDIFVQWQEGTQTKEIKVSTYTAAIKKTNE
jgi:hypothetical protein